MLKIYEKYILLKFFKIFIKICIIFLSLAIILSIFEEISFFKNSKVNPMLPYFLTLLNSPITLFETFPFIFLIASQYFFYEIIKNDELTLLKNSGLSNLKIIKILSETTLRYATSSFLSMTIYIISPLIILIGTYLLLLTKTKNA